MNELKKKEQNGGLMTETCWPYTKHDIEVLRGYYKIPEHIPNAQIDMYIGVLRNKSGPKKMKIEIREDVTALGLSYLKTDYGYS